MKHSMTAIAALMIACALVSGCAGEDPEAAKAAAAEQATAQEAKAQEGAVAFDEAVKKENWSLAKAQADVLIAQYPDSAAAKGEKLAKPSLSPEALALAQMMKGIHF